MHDLFTFLGYNTNLNGKKKLVTTSTFKIFQKKEFFLTKTVGRFFPHEALRESNKLIKKLPNKPGSLNPI